MAFHLENKINSTLQHYEMAIKGESILVAVSGGQDSMCLAHILHLLHFKIGIAHVNFKLRDKESDADEALINHWCKERNLPFYSIQFDTTSIAHAAKTGIQETARKLRYDWFDQLIHEFGYDKIATAHHLDDQAETVMFNLIRGAGLLGATGIPMIHGKIIRPLSLIPKTEITNYVIEQQIPFREDASNSKSDYTRNKIRHELLPVINQINPKGSLHLAEFGWRIQNILPGYEAWKKSLRNQYLNVHEAGITIDLHHPIQPGVLFVLLEEFEFNESQVSQLSDTILNQQKGNRFYSDQYELYCAGTTLEIRKRTLPDEEIVVQIDQLPFSLKVGTQTLNFNWVDSTSENPGNSFIQLPPSSFPLILRTWKPGDRFAPSGMGGKSKKVQDYLTDIKLSGFEKKQALVLIASDIIIWVWPEGRISEQVRPVSDPGSIMNINWSI